MRETQSPIPLASFDPFNLQPLATLNQRRIIDLPGVELDLVGQTGYAVASKPALIALMRAHAQDLGLESVEEEDYLQRFNYLPESSSEGMRIAINNIPKTHGKRLGYLLASILLSPGGLTDPLDPWEEAYLHYWREQVETLVLGGGLANGLLGQMLCQTISETIIKCGITNLKVQVAGYPSYLPLIGAARSLPFMWGGKSVAIAVVADFGGTQAKRGLVTYAADGSLQCLEVFPSRSVANLNASGKTKELAAAMVVMLADSLRVIPEGLPLIPQILVSLAAYIQDGKPLNLERGGYYALNKLSGNISAWFSEQVSLVSGRVIQVEFLHDCDAAAVALAGREKTAVLMLGSALGVGFVPQEERHRKVSSTFDIVNLL